MVVAAISRGIAADPSLSKTNPKAGASMKISNDKLHSKGLEIVSLLQHHPKRHRTPRPQRLSPLSVSVTQSRACSVAPPTGQDREGDRGVLQARAGGARVAREPRCAPREPGTFRNPNAAKMETRCMKRHGWHRKRLRMP